MTLISVLRQPETSIHIFENMVHEPSIKVTWARVWIGADRGRILQN